MQILRSASRLPPNSAACIGAFDGLHLGHRALMQCAADQAPRVALVTFEPHPAQVLAPERAPAMLQSPDQRIRVCTQIGLDALVLLPFDRDVASLSPAAFVQQFLIDGLAPVVVVVGPDFRFGADRAGGLGELRQLLAPANIRVVVADEVPLPGAADGCKLGSSQIRKAVAAGDMQVAREMLGRWFAVAGVVVHGHGRGQKLGFRTANVEVPKGHVAPRHGVYAVFLQLFDGTRHQTYPAVANLGTHPTFVQSPRPKLEVHAIAEDFGESLYGQTVEVAFVARLRDEQAFSGPAALREQIAADISAAAELLTPTAMAAIVAEPLRGGC